MQSLVSASPSNRSLNFALTSFVRGKSADRIIFVGIRLAALSHMKWRSSCELAIMARL